MWTRGTRDMIKLDFWKKKSNRPNTETVPWNEAYDRYQDTTRSSLFAGEDDWDVTDSKPMFSPAPDGRARTYEDFLRARSQAARTLDNPYGSPNGGFRRFYGEEEREGGVPVRRAMQILGSLAFVALVYFAFQSDNPTVQKAGAFVKTQLTQDSDWSAVTSWWKDNVSDKVALPASTVPASAPEAEVFELPVEGKIKTAFDGREQQGLTFTAKPGAEVLASAQGLVEKVEKEGKEDYTVTINHGSSGRTIYSHLVSVSVEANHYVKPGQPLGKLAAKGESAALFFAYEQDGAYRDPAEILKLEDGK